MRIILTGIVVTGIFGLMLTTVASAQTPVTAPPPPVITRVSPPVFSSGPMTAERRIIPITAVMIRMTLGNQLLWNGPLNIGGAGQARISLMEPIAGTNNCDRLNEARPSRQIELTIGTQGYRPSSAPDYRLSARYSRPSDGEDCSPGTRSIAIEQGFSLDGRKALTFEGDGGLKVQITIP